MSEAAGRVRVRVVVEGRVQGVGFRYFLRHQARALGVSGFARNLPDGRVEVEGEGARAAVEAFVEQVRRGPGPAGVRRAEVCWIPPTAEEGFRIG